MKPINKEQIKAAAGHVVVLRGGTSAEREISLQSGQAVLASLQRLGVQVTAVDPRDQLVDRLREVQPDLVVNALHGPNGEDGVIQGLLETLGLPLHRQRRAGLGPGHGQGKEQTHLAQPGSAHAGVYGANDRLQLAGPGGGVSGRGSQAGSWWLQSGVLPSRALPPSWSSTFGRRNSITRR